MKKAIFAALGLICLAGSANAQNSADDLTRRSIERRAVEAVIWGMPAVNYDPHVPGDAQVRRPEIGRAHV
jgi:hypothetical protein